MSVQPTSRALCHRLAGATRAYLEVLQEAAAIAAERPELADVDYELRSALEGVPTDGDARALLGTVEEAIARLGAP